MSIKRLFDVLAVCTGMLVLWPLMLLAALLVWIGLGRPILFRQPRIGFRRQVFTLIKFRTMRTASDAAGHPLSDSERLTPIGRFLRRTSLDEFPQLINVLRGELSLVGPRPLPVPYLPYYSEREQLRHSVRPGITGWAQVNGRNQSSWDDRLAKDVWYVEHQSLWLDLRILARTVTTVVFARGVLVDPAASQLSLAQERHHLVPQAPAHE